MNNISKIITKTLALFAILSLGYYFLVISPQNSFSNKIRQLESGLSTHHTNLLQNRLTFVELTKLDPDSASFNIEKSNLITSIQQTNEKGQQALKKIAKIPEIDQELSDRFPSLIEETKQVYLQQNDLLEKIFATDSYEAGIAVIKSSESITLLTKETNLILEYKYWLARLQELKTTN